MNLQEGESSCVPGEASEMAADGSGASGQPASLVHRKFKKKVTWADEGQNDESYLREIFYFELDETERGE